MTICNGEAFENMRRFWGGGLDCLRYILLLNNAILISQYSLVNYRKRELIKVVRKLRKKLIIYMNLEGSPFGKYKIIGVLGTGTYGTVYHVKSPENTDYVIKSINLENLSQAKLQRSLKEVSILESQSHSHLISYLSSCIHQKKLLILMEYASGGDLQCLINSHKTSRMYLSEKNI